jgi:hypothetical protein
LFVRADSPESPELDFLLHDDLRGFISEPSDAPSSPAVPAERSGQAEMPAEIPEEALFAAVQHDPSAIRLSL